MHLELEVKHSVGFGRFAWTTQVGPRGEGLNTPWQVDTRPNEVAWGVWFFVDTIHQSRLLSAPLLKV